ncbi:MAG: N-acetylglucosamine-6-phosphate deacetylase [Lachnospiraceae bacterium]|nr:N-acetylglucosamine-6-phosphate deacetylase [Lachnospiraceae bacterium]
MRTAVVNGKLITPHRILEGASLVIEDGKITGIVREARPGADRYLDAEGNYVSPGFIDLHTHGGGGHDFMDGTPEAIMEGCRAHLVHGTTGICPTTLTCPDQELFTFFECYRQAKARMEQGPKLLGIHLEGPYFSMEQRGAQDPRYLKVPAQDDYEALLGASEDIVRMSVAPELAGAMELAGALKARGILPSIGHSDATYETVAEAWEHGYTHVTHLYSGMSTIRRIRAFRHLGVVESAYLIDGMTVEIIADGKHLPPELLRLIVKTKPLEDICLVTDSMRGAGMADGEHVLLGSLAHGQECIIDQGVAVLPDRSAFAGSVCTADRCVRTMYHLAGVKLEDAVRMMTYNPARVLGIQNRKGTLAAGMDADLVIFDDQILVKGVMVGGMQVI